MQLGPYAVTEQEIIHFAGEFDPQPFHLDGNSQQAVETGGLIASGWHTCAIVMRMMCDAYLLDTASQGSGGLDQVRWLKPVRPGDVLTGTATVLGARISSSKPNLGLVQMEYKAENQYSETVIIIHGMGMIDVSRDAAT